MVEIVRALLTAALVLGPLAWLHRRSVLAPGWHPLLVFCTSTVVVLTAGIAGQLVLGVVLLAVGAAVLLVREALVHRHNLRATLREPATLVFGVTAVIVMVLVHGHLVTHYDNFSHWAMVWRVMLAQDALPGPENELVTFQTYPLGGASFDYLASRLVGTPEWVVMWAQSLFLAACALPLVSASGARRLVGVLLYAVGTVALLTHITMPTSLLVDSLVAGLAAALLVLVLLEREALLAHPWAFGLVAAALVTVKSSGLFFVAVATVVAVLLVVGHRASIRDRARAAWGVSLALPWLAWWMWSSHVAATFPDAGTAKHSVSVDRFDSIMAGKTADDVRAILGDLWVATVTDVRLWLLLVGVVAVGALVVRGRVLPARDQRRLLITLVATVVLWELSLALMYLYSMPLGEALRLAGLNRYQGTIHLVVALVLLAVLARWASGQPAGHPAGRVVTEGDSLPDARQPRRPSAVATAAAGLCVLVILPLVNPAGLVPETGETRREVQQALGELQREVELDDSDLVCLFLPEADAGYRVWISRYVMQHQGVTSMTLPESQQALPRRWVTCDVMVLLDPRPHTAALLADVGVEFVPGVVPQVAEPQVVEP